INTLTGATGNFPDFSYTLHPALINLPAVLADLKAANGNVAELNPTHPTYVLSGGSVSGSVTGLITGDTVSIKLTDPATGAIAAQSNGAFHFQNVPAGTWQLVLEAPSGYSVTGVPA